MSFLSKFFGRKNPPQKISNVVEVKKTIAPTYLDVPYPEKDVAKKLGARWDAELKLWFIPAGLSLDQFARWLPSANEDSELLIAPLYLKNSIERCYSCSEFSHVYCLAATQIKTIEYDDDDPNQKHTSLINNENHLVDVLNLTSIHNDLLFFIKAKAPNYFPDFSKTQGRRVWINHCEHCNAKLGDFYMHCEPGGAFYPTSDQEKSLIDKELLFSQGEFVFSGDFSLK